MTFADAGDSRLGTQNLQRSLTCCFPPRLDILRLLLRGIFIVLFICTVSDWFVVNIFIFYYHKFPLFTVCAFASIYKVPSMHKIEMRRCALWLPMSFPPVEIHRTATLTGVLLQGVCNHQRSIRSSYFAEHRW